ncbi:hypothetical protein [Absidia glauca]|uniref:Uncharacterized protein n=1 Tax=Absidia glauca TaxID=4829 RepID=A0A168PQI7_ABSGL|nr:hypothetical protein [Absidia glauca]
MHRHTLALFFSLTLLSVAFAQPDAPPDSTYGDILGFGDVMLGGYGGGIESTHGKPCRSVLDCTDTWDYCIDKICQEKQAGRDCVAEGSIYTGGKSCCPPMANPRQVNTPCRILSLTSCKDDRDCSIRNGVERSKCCPNYDNGNGYGICIQTHVWAKRSIRAYLSSHNVKLQSNKLQSKMNFCYRHKPCDYSDWFGLCACND